MPLSQRVCIVTHAFCAYNPALLNSHGYNPESPKMGLLDFLKRDKSPAAVRHTVKVMPRETLRTIAEREYGDQDKWEVIFNKNKWRFDGADPNTIYPGMDLDIPEITSS